MDRDEAEKITNDSELLAGKLYIAQGNSIYPYEELGEASKELFRPLARYVIELLAALTAQGQEVDLHREIMNIKIDEDNMKFVIKEAIALGTHHNGNIEHVNAEKMVEWGYRLSHRDCRHAAAEIVAGHRRKVS